MALLHDVKRLSIATGLYRPARWLSRRLRPAQLRAFREDVALYRSLLVPGSLCFDVGANIGEKSEALLEAGARVVSFEPNPLLLPEVEARCSPRKNWSLVAAAVGSRASLATLYVRASHGQSSLSGNWQGRVVSTVTVPVVTLDSAILHFGTPFYVKIDVEGWELEVLLGLTQQVPLLSFEFHLTGPDIARTSACLERLVQCGPGRVNVTAAESSSFHLREWMPLREFLAWFPGDLQRTLPGHRYGDIFVRADAVGTPERLSCRS